MDNTITKEDVYYINKIMNNIEVYKEIKTFNDEIKYINKVQNTVIELTNLAIGSIPINMSREPKDIYMTKIGACVERSRTIEKILRYSGFKIRHIAIYSTENTDSALISLFTPKIASHSLSEVLTSKGWMLIDSATLWIALNKNNNPISIEKLQNNIMLELKQKPTEPVLTQEFTFLYGLYSRHGKFYYPYNMIPDIEYNEFLYNIIGN